MVRQDGCFLMGGVPSTQPARNLHVPEKRPLHADEIRTCMSVPFVLINYNQAEAAYNGEALPGQPPKARAFTLRITADKSELRLTSTGCSDTGTSPCSPTFPALPNTVGASNRRDRLGRSRARRLVRSGPIQPG
jgi:hypothetical protein